MSRMEGVKKRCTKHGKYERVVALVNLDNNGIVVSFDDPLIKVWYCPKCHDIKMREDE